MADSLTGQDAVETAGRFNERLKLTGLILTRMDGDGRGGAALSMRAGGRRIGGNPTPRAPAFGGLMRVPCGAGRND